MTDGKTTARRTASKRLITTFLAVALIGGNSSASAGWLDKLKEIVSGDEEEQQVLGADEIGGGLKEALRVGTENVVSNLGVTDGFNLDPQIRIPLPEQLGQVKTVLAKVGMDSMLTDLETQLNRAAEVATPKAKQLFFGAIQDMTLDDVMSIYNGPDDSATQYFRSRMSEPLAVEMKPVVDASLSDVGAAKSYEAVMDRYNSVPFVPRVDADLSNYVVEKSMDGIFYYLAREEAAIRQDPAKRTTDLLKRVFTK